MCPEKHAALATTDQNINPYVLIARRFTAAPEPPYGTGCHRRNDVVRFDRVYRCWSGSYERADHHVGCPQDRKSTRLNSSHVAISYAVFCLKKKRRKPPFNGHT